MATFDEKWENGKDDAKRALLRLREAQDNLLSVMFDLDDNSALEQALTLIGDTMDGISACWNLPIMSEQ